MFKGFLFLICLADCLYLSAQENNAANIWGSTLGSGKATQLIKAVADFDSSFQLNTNPLINDKGRLLPFMLLGNGNKLLFYIQEKFVPILVPSVDVYSYNDVEMQDEQLRDVAIQRKYAVVFDFKTSRLIRLEKEGVKLVASYFSQVSNIQINDQYVLVYDFGADIFTYEKDGGINEGVSMAQYTWNKGLNCDVYLVSLHDGSRKLIKKNVEPNLGGFPFFRLSPGGNYVLSYEYRNYYSYNIASGLTRCISKNISNNFIKSENYRNYYNPGNNVVAWPDSTHVSVKDVHSDAWQLDLSGDKQPVKQPRKKENLKQVKNVNASESNEESIVTEEIRWKDFDGKWERGVLEKPKDFDQKKKYPIIFVYYENSVVKHPEDKPYGVGDLVDYGYLVFSPDINYVIGETGKSVFNVVVSAAEYLSKKPYVDAKKMGIKGASFGGYETNYLITHTNLFAAAISSAGYSDFVANIGALNNGSRPHGLEGTDQNRLGVTLWQRPDIWIKNSPIFYADRVTTPLLLIHSKSDDNVPFEQSLAFFRALRSLGKRSWLLQYDNAGHMGMNTTIIGKPGPSCDLCTRQLQFFNHYLKEDPAPLWMLDGIPARDKGKKTGLELDTLGRTPGPGLRRDKLILTSEQEELLKHRTMVTDDGRVIDVGEKKKWKR